MRLDALYVRPPALPTRFNGAGIDMTGEVRGMLREWVPTADGGWVGIVNFDVPYVDGRDRPRPARDQLVPSYALRLREE
ncbi:hypothetical protein [Nocardia terpenica]|uniref:Uncharacterized protein n=1 Tax=Nocardia terpenica TaxID=455432 RepID=A0A164JII3_9NOCA|nr:hypothetical protein [Nocardia terpenica]KZM70436.1 hypothetical protein AWN90_03915 [Nocardia terpenica]NQE91118.1 hypothetical protein [Nocardia terpenica]